jgi:hypothetical protein
MAKRKLRASSSWALLDTLEVTMYNSEVDAIAARRRREQGTPATTRLPPACKPACMHVGQSRHASRTPDSMHYTPTAFSNCCGV